ncbi:MAG: type II secretion system GspH family protein [Phycisphaerales bacterium]|nr:type II secretion system GspH family protein [Phycisphaerales bacterium]
MRLFGTCQCNAPQAPTAPVARDRHAGGFSLIELVVVVAILAMLTGFLLPSMQSMSRRSQVSVDMSNLRSLQMAHYQYALASDGMFADAGLAHGGLENQDIAWLNLISEYVDIDQIVRSPLDLSPHWDVPVEGTTNRFRRTSYGWNNYLSRTHSPDAALDPLDVVDRLSRLKSPSKTVHLMHMAAYGDYAGADHVHVENWWISDAHPDAPAVLASNQVETNIVSGEPKSKQARAVYGFVDGHVQVLSFLELFARPDQNRLDPKVSGFSF